MSVQKLLSQNVASVGSSYDNKDYYLVGPSLYYSSVFSSQPNILALSQGNVINHVQDFVEPWEIRGLKLQYDAVNSSTDSAIFKNAWTRINYAKCFANNQEVQHIQDLYQIREAVSTFLEGIPQAEIYTELAKHRNETTATNAGEQYTASSTTFHQIDMLVLFPWLRGIITNISGLNKLSFEIGFNPNSSTPAINNLFVQSSTTNNAYSSNLTLSNIQMKFDYVKHTDSRMLKQMPNTVMYVCKQMSKIYPNKSWTNIGTDGLTINLFNDFSPVGRCVALSTLFYNNTANSAYNSADSCKFRSGPAIAGFTIKRGSEILVDYQGAKNLHNRQEYFLNSRKWRNGTDLPLEVLNDASDLFEYYQSFKFDLTNIIETSATDPETALSGRPNNTNDYEINLTCASSISANVNIIAVLHYLEIFQLDPKSGSLRKLQ